MVASRKQQAGVYIFMIFPAVCLFALLIVFPVLRTVYLGFTKFNVFIPSENEWVGLENYIRIFSDPLFWRAFSNNMFVVGISLLGQIPIALILSYILFRKFVRFQNFFLAMVFLPQTISTIIIGILWRWLVINPNGLVAQLLQIITNNPDAMLTWGLQLSTAMIPIGLVLIWMYTGFYVLIFSANLQKISGSIVEAAEIDGANEWHIFRHIILPLQTGSIVVSSILSIAGSLKGFDLIWAMTQGGPADYTIVLPIYMYKYAFKTNEIDAYSYGSAVATIIMIVSVVFILGARAIGSYMERKRGEV